MLTELKSYSLFFGRSFLYGLLLLLSAVVLFTGIIAVALVVAALTLFAAGYTALRRRKGDKPTFVGGNQQVIPGSFMVVREWRLEDKPN